MIEIGGYGYEFNSEHYGGPFDGSTDTVVSFNEFPPRYHVLVIDAELDDKKKLGQKLMEAWKMKHLPNDTWVAVYKIEGRPEEYDDDQTVPYHYIQTMQVKDYKEQFGD